MCDDSDNMGSQSICARSMLWRSGGCHLQQGSQLLSAAHSSFKMSSQGKSAGMLRGTVVPRVSCCCLLRAAESDHPHRGRVHEALKLAPHVVMHGWNLDDALQHISQREMSQTAL